MQNVLKQGPYTIQIRVLWIRCLLEMRLQPQPSLIPNLLVVGEVGNNLHGATLTMALCMCHKILETEEIKEKKKHIYIFADREITSRGHNICWVSEILESLFVFV